jgi:uncharacterized protein YgiM (DUF1202 family)
LLLSILFVSSYCNILGYNKAVKHIFPKPIFYILLTVILLLSSACSAEVTVPDTPTPTAQIIITSTLPPTQTPRPSATPEPPTPTVAVAPAEGQTISQLNVRSAPSATSNLLGTVEIFADVQIVGKDPTSGWWLIVYPQSPTGTGWITAQFVQVENTQDVPVISAGGQQPQGTVNTPQAEAGPTVGTGSAAAPSAEPTLGLATALQDGDSIQSPSASVSMSKVAVRTFNYSSDISTPEGDPEDWIQFTLEGELGQQMLVSVTLNCTGSSPLNVELIQNESLLQGWSDIFCGHPSQLQLQLFVGAPYYLRLSPAQGNNSINYVAYTVIVQLMQ